MQENISSNRWKYRSSRIRELVVPLGSLAVALAGALLGLYSQTVLAPIKASKLDKAA